MYLTFYLEWIINNCITIKELSGEDDKNAQYPSFFQKTEPTTQKQCLFISPSQSLNRNEGAVFTCWAQDESLTGKVGGQSQWRGQEQQQLKRPTGGVHSPSPFPHVSGPLGVFTKVGPQWPKQKAAWLGSTAVQIPPMISPRTNSSS